MRNNPWYHKGKIPFDSHSILLIYKETFMNYITGVLTNLIITILDMAICMTYFHMISGKKKSISTFLRIVSHAIIEIPIAFNIAFLNNLQTPPMVGILYLLVAIPGLLFISMLYEAVWRHRIFTIIAFQVFQGASAFCSYCLLNLFIYIAPESAITADTFSILFVSKLILGMLVLLAGNFYHHKRKLHAVQYNFSLLCVPIISTFIITAVLNVSINPWTPAGIVLNSFTSIGLIAICLLNCVLLDIQLQNQDLKDILFHLEQQNTLQQMKYNQSTSAYKEARRVLHDSRKHLLYLRECAKQTDNQMVADYINQNLSELDNARIPVHTGNLAIDALIGNAEVQAREMNIPVTTNIQINVSELPLPDYDLCIILGNLTDNALTALRSMKHSRKPYMTIELFMTKEQLICRFVNATVPRKAGIYDPEQAFRDNALPQHGYGLYNVFRIADKYHGLTHFEQKEQEYEANVIIPLFVNKGDFYEAESCNL